MTRDKDDLCRHKTKGIDRSAARTIRQLVAHAPITMLQLTDKTLPWREFRR
jgi:hypothetical protein